jgi:hypothetical protein
MNDSILTKSRNRSDAASIDNTLAGQAVSKSAIYGVVAASGIIGIWALACFVGGMISSGGPIAMAKGWLTAVTGM